MVMTWNPNEDRNNHGLTVTKELANIGKTWGEDYPGPRDFIIWKFATRSADRNAEPREKKASGQDR